MLVKVKLSLQKKQLVIGMNPLGIYPPYPKDSDFAQIWNSLIRAQKHTSFFQPSVCWFWYR